MQRYVALLLTLLLATSGNADPDHNAEQVVRDMITAVHKDRLEAFLRTIDIGEISANSNGTCKIGDVYFIAAMLVHTDLTFESRTAAHAAVVRATNRWGIDAFFVLHAHNKTLAHPQGWVIVDIRAPSMLPPVGLTRR